MFAVALVMGLLRLILIGGLAAAQRFIPLYARRERDADYRPQAVEYVTSQNLDRRAFVALNCITVVPGAIGAWRRSAVQAVGAFQHDTMAEDQDLTLTLLRHGHRVALADRATARTEVPIDAGCPPDTALALEPWHAAM